MQRLLSLWKNTSKNGNAYYTGKIGNVGLIAFENNDKQNDKQPDLTIYVKEEQKEEVEKKENKDIENDPFAEFGEQVVEIDNEFLD